MAPAGRGASALDPISRLLSIPLSMSPAATIGQARGAGRDLRDPDGPDVDLGLLLVAALRGR